MKPEDIDPSGLYTKLSIMNNNLSEYFKNTIKSFQNINDKIHQENIDRVNEYKKFLLEIKKLDENSDEYKAAMDEFQKASAETEALHLKAIEIKKQEIEYENALYSKKLELANQNRKNLEEKEKEYKAEKSFIEDELKELRKRIKIFKNRSDLSQDEAKELDALQKQEKDLIEKRKQTNKDILEAQNKRNQIMSGEIDDIKTGLKGAAGKFSLDKNVKGMRAQERKAITERAQDLRDELLAKKAAGQELSPGEKENLKKLNSVLWKQDVAEKTRQKAAENMKALATAIENDMKVWTSYQSAIATRLQGSDTKYTDLVNKITTTFAISPYVTQQKVLENLSKLVESGIAYDIESRTFLASMSDKIATTFNSFSDNLMRLIRIQQADTTSYRLGMEAYLTKMFNNLFKDTSYLSGLSETIKSSIIDAEAQMSKENALEFEFTTQKWLGSLSSVGATDNLLQNLATGINYLGTGNVSALSSNENLMRLMAIGTARAGYDIGSILQKGLTSQEANDILYQTVLYLSEIANNDNLVVKSALGNVFGFNTTDLRSISNLNDSVLGNIYNTNLNQSGMLNELKSQLTFNNMYQRIPLAEMISNLMSNVQMTAAGTIVENPALYAIYTMADTVQSITGGISTPSILGNSIGGTIEGWVKAGIMGMGLLGAGVKALIGLSNGGSLNMDNWDFQEYNTLGKGITTQPGGITSGTSESTAYRGSASTEDIESSTLSSASDTAQGRKDVIKKKNAESENPDMTVEDVYNALFKDRIPVGVQYIEEEPYMTKLITGLFGSEEPSTSIIGLETEQLNVLQNLNKDVFSVSDKDVVQAITSTGRAVDLIRSAIKDLSSATYTVKLAQGEAVKIQINSVSDAASKLLKNTTNEISDSVINALGKENKDCDDNSVIKTLTGIDETFKNVISRENQNSISTYVENMPVTIP